jgi:hypothetical protein
MVAITGNTFPVKDQLRELGGKWDAANKAWLVPDDVADKAKAIVAGAKSEPMTKAQRIAAAARRRGEKPGVCSSCGAQCKYPWTECWDCKEERDMGY